jgi:hypothetical protein
MRKYFLVLLVAVGMMACNNSNKESGKSAETETAVTKSTEAVFPIDELLADAEKYVDQPVKVKGYVTHTCKHAGKRCFLTDESQEVSVRVEAKGKIGGFNRELIGSEIEVEGVLHERRVSPQEIDKMEEDIAAKRISEDGSAESCDAETANVEKMRNWMKEKGRDYYAIYYIDGENFREIE